MRQKHRRSDPLALRDVASAPVQALTAELLGGRRAASTNIDSDEAAHRAVLRGIPGSALTELLSRIQIMPRAALLTALGVSERSLARRKAAPKALLPADEADRLWRVAEAIAHATRVFGTQVEAERWLQLPAIGLGGHTPITIA